MFHALPHCTTVYNVDTGDTCDNIIQSFDVKAEDFASFNPNLNCDDLFVGEYVCINGTLSSWIQFTKANNVLNSVYAYL